MKYKVEDPTGLKRQRYVEAIESEIEETVQREVERLHCDFSWGVEALKNCANECDSWKEWEESNGD